MSGPMRGIPVVECNPILPVINFGFYLNPDQTSPKGLGSSQMRLPVSCTSVSLKPREGQQRQTGVGRSSGYCWTLILRQSTAHPGVRFITTHIHLRLSCMARLTIEIHTKSLGLNQILEDHTVFGKCPYELLVQGYPPRNLCDACRSV